MKLLKLVNTKLKVRLDPEEAVGVWENLPEIKVKHKNIALIETSTDIVH